MNPKMAQYNTLDSRQLLVNNGYTQGQTGSSMYDNTGQNSAYMPRPPDPPVNDQTFMYQSDMGPPGQAQDHLNYTAQHQYPGGSLQLPHAPRPSFAHLAPQTFNNSHFGLPPSSFNQPPKADFRRTATQSLGVPTFFSFGNNPPANQWSGTVSQTDMVSANGTQPRPQSAMRYPHMTSYQNPSNHLLNSWSQHPQTDSASTAPHYGTDCKPSHAAQVQQSHNPYLNRAPFYSSSYGLAQQQSYDPNSQMAQGQAPHYNGVHQQQHDGLPHTYNQGVDYSAYSYVPQQQQLDPNASLAQPIGPASSFALPQAQIAQASQVAAPSRVLTRPRIAVASQVLADWKPPTASVQSTAARVPTLHDPNPEFLRPPMGSHVALDANGVMTYGSSIDIYNRGNGQTGFSRALLTSGFPNRPPQALVHTLFRPSRVPGGYYPEDAQIMKTERDERDLKRKRRHYYEQRQQKKKKSRHTQSHSRQHHQYDPEQPDHARSFTQHPDQDYIMPSVERDEPAETFRRPLKRKRGFVPKFGEFNYPSHLES